MTLTDRRREYLAAIQALTERRGFPPTHRELGRHLGVSSTNGVSEIVQALESLGLVRHWAGLARTLRLTRRGLAVVSVRPSSLSLQSSQGKAP